MSFEEFTSSLKNQNPPSGISLLLLSMWHDGKEDWESAHNVAQEINTRDGAWIHAYLHRKEGDIGNAGYWYNRAGRKMSNASLSDEWKMIVNELLEKK